MIVVTAATPWESGPLSSAWDLSPSAGEPPCWEGRAGGSEVLLVRTGIGPERCREALSRIGARLPSPPELVVSSGLAGALQPDVRPGELVFDPHGAPLAVLEEVRAAASEAGVALHVGRMVSTSQVLCEPAQKRALGESRRAVAVDMESAAARLWAAERGSPFIALRAVLDGLEDRLPGEAPEGAGAAHAARYLAAHWRELPSLLRLAVRQRRGLRSLALVMGRLFGRMPCALS